MDLVITFTSPSEGGREHLPDLQSGLYRPHVVVYDRSKDEYLGVQFVGCNVTREFGTEALATVRLPYEGVDYSPLTEGACFVIKEGRREVDSGRVVELWRSATPDRFSFPLFLHKAAQRPSNNYLLGRVLSDLWRKS